MAYYIDKYIRICVYTYCIYVYIYNGGGMVSYNVNLHIDPLAPLLHCAHGVKTGCFEHCLFKAPLMKSSVLVGQLRQAWAVNTHTL